RAQGGSEVFHAEAPQGRGQWRVMIQIHRRADRRLELAPVRLEDGRAAILKEIVVIRIDDDWNPATARVGDRLLNETRHKNALVVVLQDERVGLVDRHPRPIEEAIYLAALEVRVLL